MADFCSSAQVAQSVEQRTENPRVDGSIPPLGTIKMPTTVSVFLCPSGVFPVQSASFHLF